MKIQDIKSSIIHEKIKWEYLEEYGYMQTKLVHKIGYTNSILIDINYGIYGVTAIIDGRKHNFIIKDDFTKNLIGYDINEITHI